jgi:hypothetical protein
MTGFDHNLFLTLLQKFAPVFDDHTPFNKRQIELKEDPKKGGQPRVMRPEDCLGLVLVWTWTRGSMTALQLIFGLSYANLCVYLRFGCRIIIKVFRDDPLARIGIPSEEKIHEYMQAVAERYPRLPDVWSTMDGLKLYLQQSGKSDVQERFYNGWTHNHYVTSVFVFCPNGIILIAFFNVPGAVHDSQIAHWGKIYDKLDEVYKAMGGKCTVDSAFAKLNCPFLIMSSQDILISSAQTTQEQREEIQRNIQATSMRQALRDRVPISLLTRIFSDVRGNSCPCSIAKTQAE